VRRARDFGGLLLALEFLVQQPRDGSTIARLFSTDEVFNGPKSVRAA
jgi:hypothetical protein